MVARKKRLFYVGFLICTASSMFATIQETIETVRSGAEAVKSLGEAVKTSGGFLKEFVLEPIANCLHSDTIDALQSTVRNLEADKKGLEGTVVTLKTVVDVLEAQKIADAARYASLVTNIKWAIGIGVVGVIVIGGGWYVYRKYNPSEETLKNERRIKLCQVKGALYKCLFNNEKAAKDGEGMPMNCKEEMQTYLDAAGQSKLNKIKHAYNHR